jgi:hypothetical protein
MFCLLPPESPVFVTMPLASQVLWLPDARGDVRYARKKYMIFIR